MLFALAFLRESESESMDLELELGQLLISVIGSVQAQRLSEESFGWPVDCGLYLFSTFRWAAVLVLPNLFYDHRPPD